MKSNSSVFVKVNCKSISESKSLIIDREGTYDYNKNKYLIVLENMTEMVGQ